MIHYSIARIDTAIRARRTHNLGVMFARVMAILHLGNPDGEPFSQWRNFQEKAGTVTQAQLDALAKLLDLEADLDGLKLAIAPLDRVRVKIDERFDAQNAAIRSDRETVIRYEGVRRSLFDTGQHPVVAGKLYGRIDKVTFERPDGENFAGEYLVLGPASDAHGAIILPVDFGQERVALVRQFRYPLGRFLYEAPRGFAGPFERPAGVALRELLGETGLQPMTDGTNVDGEDVLRMWHLGALYTDTSFMTTQPNVFLAEVAIDDFDASLLQKRLHRNVTFVGIDRFYAALFDVQQLREGEDFSVSDGTGGGTLALRLEDAMTVNAALLALPQLEARLGRRISLPTLPLVRTHRHIDR